MSDAEPRTLMRWIISSSLKFRHLVVAAGVGLMGLGIAVLPQMHVDVFPEFAPPRVVIQTACVGLSTSDVEQLVTVPLEASLNGVQGLDVLRSKSVPQLSSIEMLFKPGTDLLQARQLVQERLTTVSPSLPTWAAPPVMLAPVSATGRAMQIGMTSRNHSLIEMSMTAYWTIPGPPAPRSRRRQRGHLERAAQADGGAGGTVEDAGRRGLARPGDADHLRRS